MKQVLLIFVLLAIAASAASGGVRSARIELPRQGHIYSVATTSLPQPSSPEAALRQFYHWYVHMLNQNGDPLGKQKAALKKYITRRLYLELVNREKRGEIDYDYFLNAQDWDHDWENNITVAKPSIRAGKATAVVSLSGRQLSVKLLVTLKEEDGSWKIDNVSTRSPR